MRRLSGADRRAEQRTQLLLLDRLAARMERRFAAEIARVMREAASAFEATGQVTVADDHEARVRALMSQSWSQSIEVFGGRVLASAKGRHGPAWTKAPDEAPLWERIFADFIASWGARKIVAVTDTTRAQVREIVERGRANGDGVEAVARAIREKAPAIARLRSHVIARTETHGAANYSSRETAKETGLILRKEWISALDERTRTEPFDHVGADGEIVDMDQPFMATGEALMSPGDPAGSPGNVIMCRCAQAFVEPD